MGVTATLYPFVGPWKDGRTALDVPSKALSHLLLDLCANEEASLRGGYSVPTVHSWDHGERIPVLTREQVLSIPVGEDWMWEAKAAWAYVAALPEGASVAVEFS